MKTRLADLLLAIAIGLALAILLADWSAEDTEFHNHPSGSNL